MLKYKKKFLQNYIQFKLFIFQIKYLLKNVLG